MRNQLHQTVQTRAGHYPERCIRRGAAVGVGLAQRKYLGIGEGVIEDHEVVDLAVEVVAAPVRVGDAAPPGVGADRQVFSIVAQALRVVRLDVDLHPVQVQVRTVAAEAERQVVFLTRLYRAGARAQPHLVIVALQPHHDLVVAHPGTDMATIAIVPRVFRKQRVVVPALRLVGHEAEGKGAVAQFQRHIVVHLHLVTRTIHRHRLQPIDR